MIMGIKTQNNLNLLDKTFKHLLTITNKNFYRMAIMLNNHPLVINILTKAVIKYMRIHRKYLQFYDTQGRAIEDFVSALDALSNAKVIHWIIDPY